MFRFTIRDVLWLTVVVAVGVGWWADHRQSAHDREIVRALKRIGLDTEQLIRRRSTTKR